MKTFKITNIQFDADSSEEFEGVPTELTIEVDTNQFETDMELEEFISDQISNKTGFCHTGYSVSPKISL